MAAKPCPPVTCDMNRHTISGLMSGPPTDTCQALELQSSQSRAGLYGMGQSMVAKHHTLMRVST